MKKEQAFEDAREKEREREVGNALGRGGVE